MSRISQKVLNDFSLYQPVYYVVLQLLSIFGFNYEIIDDFESCQLFFHLLIVSDELKSYRQKIIFKNNSGLFS